MIITIIKNSLINPDKNAARWQAETMNEASTDSSLLRSIFGSSNKPQHNSSFVGLFPLGGRKRLAPRMYTDHGGLGFWGFFASFIHKVTLAGTKMKISCKQKYFAVEVQYGKSLKSYRAFAVWALRLIMDYLT